MHVRVYVPLLFLEEIKASPAFYIANVVAEFRLAIRQLHQIFVSRHTFILVPRETAALADLLMLLKLLAAAAAAALLVHASAIILLRPVLAHARCADAFLLA
jgi:hypothetical protein